jgi:hypothetical protein
MGDQNRQSQDKGNPSQTGTRRDEHGGQQQGQPDRNKQNDQESGNKAGQADEGVGDDAAQGNRGPGSKGNQNR